MSFAQKFLILMKSSFCDFPFFLLMPLESFRLPGGLDDKASACSAGDLDLIPGLGRLPGEGNDNPLQYSCLENSVD